MQADYIKSKPGIGICALNALTNFMGEVIWTDIQQFLETTARSKGVNVANEVEQYQQLGHIFFDIGVPIILKEDVDDFKWYSILLAHRLSEEDISSLIKNC